MKDTIYTHIDSLTKWGCLFAIKEETFPGNFNLFHQVMIDPNQLPSSNNHFFISLSNKDGGVGGFPQTKQHAIWNAVHHRTKEKGLWLCGDIIFPGAEVVSEHQVQVCM